MQNVIINDKDIVTMNLVHYFITEQNYNPIIVHGINDEIWLENMKSDYKIIRIVSRYIHNNEQLGLNRNRCYQVAKKLKIKTLTFRMNMLSIYTDIGENVTNLDNEFGNNISIFIKNISDLKKYPSVMEIFPSISEKTKHTEKGMDLLFKITNDINITNEKKGKNLDKIFSSKKPIITYIFIFICGIMFLLSNMGYSNELLIRYGALSKIFIKNGEIIRLVSYMFLHGGLLHIILNMYSLFIIGPRIEDFFGKWKYLLIYLISGISGGLLSIGMNDNALIIGASGAIFGLFGALLYFGYNYRGYIGAIVKSQVLPIVIYNLLLGFIIPGIDIWGHIGGLIGGIITANMLGTIENKKYNYVNILLFIMYIGFIIYFGIFI